MTQSFYLPISLGGIHGFTFFLNQAYLRNWNIWVCEIWCGMFELKGTVVRAYRGRMNFTEWHYRSVICYESHHFFATLGSSLNSSHDLYKMETHLFWSATSVTCLSSAWQQAISMTLSVKYFCNLEVKRKISYFRSKKSIWCGWG